MDQSNVSDMVKQVAGVAGGAALIAPAAPLAPLAPPLLHGLAGIAVVGLGLFAAGSLVMKAAEVLTGRDNPAKKQDSGTTTI